MHCHSLTAFLILISSSLVMADVFPADAVVNVTAEPYGAVPDDGVDDTAAIQRAVTENIGTGRSLYFPAGQYDLSAPIIWKNADGIWRAHLTLRGESRDNTVLKLQNDATGYGEPNQPKAMIVTASHWDPGDRDNGGGNKAFRNNLYDLTLDTGSANPGAVGVDWAVNNVGCLERLTIRSGDGAGVAGVSMQRKNVGPALIKDVCVEGFDVGLAINDVQYGMTFEDVKVTGQRVAGIRTDKNVLHIRGLTSHNAVPAVVVTDRSGVLTLLDSRLKGTGAKGAKGGTGLAVEVAGTLLARGLNISGYADQPVKAQGTTVSLSQNQQWAVPGMDRPGPATPLIKPVDTPAYGPDDPAQWQVVGPRRDGEHDDTAAIQRALDAGKPTVYFRNDRVYHISDTLVIHGHVRRLIGMGVELNLGAAREPFSDIKQPRPLIRIDPTEAQAVFIEDFLFNAQYPGEVIFEHNARNDLVLRHLGGWVGSDGHARSYRATPAANDARVFIEDVYLPGWAFTGQHVWARQFNPENWAGRGDEPQVLNDAGRLWILGFKTEGPAPYIETRRGGVSELLGSYNYLNASKVLPTDKVPFVVEDARAALTFVAENFDRPTYRHYLRWTDPAGKTHTTSAKALPPRNGHDSDRSRAVPLWQSNKTTAK